MAFEKPKSVHQTLYLFLLRIGLVPAMALTTALSVALSVGICSIIYSISNNGESFHDWAHAAILTPLFVAPIISYLWLCMAYELKQTQAELRLAATTDQLTGAANRRHLLDSVSQTLTQGSALPCSLLLIDIDHFKSINDHYGHSTGDEVLVLVANACRSQLRSGDMFARWGGEEFIVFLCGSDACGAWRVAEDLRRAVEAVRPARHRLSVTISVGIGTYTDTSIPFNFDQTLSLADVNLYEAKRQGRNRTIPIATAA